MPANQVDFFLPLTADGTLQVNLTPSTSISGWTIQADLLKRFFGQPIISKYLASGYINGESGMTLVNGATGVFQISFTPGEMSGRNEGNYPYQVVRTDSGNVTPTTCGFRLANL